MKTIAVILVFTVIALLVSGEMYVSFAQEVVTENDSGESARAMGMGGAQIAAAEGAASLLYNPAALARTDELEIQFGLNMLKREVNTILKSSSGTGEKDALTDYTGLGSIGIAYPVPTDRGSLVFGLGYNRVKDFAGRLELDGYNDYLQGNQLGESIEEGGLGIVSFAGAVDVSPNVSVGASLDVWFGEYRRDEHMLLNDYSYPYSQLDMFGVEDDISAWSIKPAILYHKDKFRFGAYARLPMTFHIKEYNYSEGYSRDDGEYFKLYEIIDPYSEFTDEEVTYSDHMSYKIEAPMQMGFGVSYGNPGRNCFALDLIYENWTQAKLRYPSDYMPEPNYFRDKYRSALNWRVGVEKELPFFDTVGRIGYMHRPLIFKGPRGYGSDNSPISISNERDFITFGLGKQFDETLSMDIGYSQGFWSQKEDPREDEESNKRVYVSLTYRMFSKK